MKRQFVFLGTKISSVQAHTYTIGLLGLLLMQCTAAPPFLVKGTPGDISDLAGDWEGLYSSESSGRAGTIAFSLEADADTAHGEVVMMPRRWGQPIAKGDTLAKQTRPDLLHTLKIRFMQIEGRQIKGMLEPYRDPDCGCERVATFYGTVQRDKIEGTYVSVEAGGSGKQEGHWQVERRKRLKKMSQ